ncbi:MAG TPA: hypothetical protein VF060_24855 [Trebonia sp.]
MIQPAISATTDSGPAATTAHKTSRGSPRRLNLRYRYTSPSRASSEPIPTMVWNEIRTTLTGGWSASGTMLRPRTTAEGLWSASSDSNRGISMPHTTACPLYQPSKCSAAPRVVVASPSIAASFTGWYVATSRAAQSPTITCSGEATAAEVSVMPSAVRSYRPRLPRSIAHAYAPASRNPHTM